MNTPKAMRQSSAALPASAVCHKNVDLTSVDYNPDRPFKGFHTADAGVIVIIGLDGNRTTFTIPAGGAYPYGGSVIVRTGTTCTGIVALF